VCVCVCVCEVSCAADWRVCDQGKGIQTTYWLMGRKGSSWFSDYVVWTSSADSINARRVTTWTKRLLMSSRSWSCSRNFCSTCRNFG